MTINRLNQGTTNQVLVKAISGQTTNLLELQDSSGNVVSSIGPTGALGGTVSQPQGLVHIKTESFTNVASQALNDVFSATYKNYKVFLNLTMSTSLELRYRFRIPGVGDDISTNYRTRINTAATTYVFSINSQDAGLGILKTTNADPISNEITFFNPFETAITSGMGFANFGIVGSTLYQGFIFNDTTSFSGIRFFTSTGTISGQISIYGIKD